MRTDSHIERIASIIIASDDYIYDPDHKMRHSDLPAGKKWFETPRGWTTNPYEATGLSEHNELGYQMSQKRQIENKLYRESPEMKAIDKEYSQVAKAGDISKAKQLIFKYAYLKEKVIDKSTWMRDLSGNQTEVIKNPTPRDLKDILETGVRNREVGVIISVSGNTYAFRRDNNLHHEVARNLGLKEFVGINLGNGRIEVTSTTTPNLKRTSEPRKMIEDAFPYIPSDRIRYSTEEYQAPYNPIHNLKGYIPSLYTRFNDI